MPLTLNKTYKLLAPAHLVRVTFDQPEDGEGVASFSCVPCEDELLRWYSSHNLWVCPTCEQELHLADADWVIARSLKAFAKLQQDVKTKRGSQWGLVRWFKKLWPVRRR